MSYSRGGIKAGAIGVSVIAQLGYSGAPIADLTLHTRRHIIGDGHIVYGSYTFTALTNWYDNYTSGKAKETDIAGEYRLCLADEIFATGTYGINKVDLCLVYTDPDGNVYKWADTIYIDESVQEWEDYVSQVSGIYGTPEYMNINTFDFSGSNSFGLDFAEIDLISESNRTSRTCIFNYYNPSASINRMYFDRPLPSVWGTYFDAGTVRAVIRNKRPLAPSVYHADAVTAQVSTAVFEAYVESFVFTSLDVGKWLLFISGNLAGQMQKISSVDVGTNRITVNEPFSAQPDVHSVFVVFNDKAPSPKVLDDYISGIHGTGNWQDENQAKGANQVTVHVHTSTVPVVGKQVTVRLASNLTAVYATAITDSNGDAVFSLMNGTFKVYVDTGYQYNSVAPTTAVVSTTTAVDILLTDVSIYTVAPADMCRIHALIIGNDGNPKEGVVLSATLLMVGSGEYNSKLLDPIAIKGTSDANGYVEIFVLRSDVIEAHVLGDSTDYRITVPECRVAFSQSVADDDIDLGVLLPL